MLLTEATAGQGDAASADPLATLYLHEPGTFRPVAQLRRALRDAPASVHHYHLDALGTPQELTNDNGAITWRADLKAWGGIARQAEADVPNPIRFQGQYADEETGLHYNRFRYYDPVVARYVSPDPIGLAGGPNAYAYVPDPNSSIDPLGLATVPCRFDWKAGRLREAATGRFHPWRADPKTYMSAKEIDTHLAPFRNGVSKIMWDAPNRAVGPPQGHYVMSRADANAVVARTGGDPRLIEKELGLQNGELGNHPHLVEIDNPRNLRMSSGNEPGANEKWIPRGVTSGGVHEAVIDQVPLSEVRIIPIVPSP